MIRILKSRNIWLIILLWGGFWLVAPYIERVWLFDLLNSLAIGGCVGVFLMYFPSIARMLPRNDLDGAHYLVMGICGFMLSQAGRYIWNWTWRYLGKPEGMQDHLFVGFLIWMAFTSACVHLLARGILAGNIPRENYRWLGTVVGVGVAVGAMVVAFLEP